MAMRVPEFPGAVEPERARTVLSLGVRLNVVEWGDPGSEPILLCHGMWDHARSFALLAPLLARRFRVVAMESRGHGDSGWARAYTWRTDVFDVINVLRSLGRPAHLVGHSRGGGQAVDAAIELPDLVRRVVNIDGFGPPPAEDDASELPRQMSEFLDRRQRLTNGDRRRFYPTLDALVERRQAQNPRLSRPWLRYFVFHGAHRAAQGWHWKVDPHVSFGFGPWRPEWITEVYGWLRVPMLAIVGSEDDTWGPLAPVLVAERLSHVRQLERCTIDGAGHFVHMERPAETADALLAFLS